MDNATDISPSPEAPTASNAEYYARTRITDISAAPIFLFVLGLLIFIAGCVQWHIGIMAASIVIMFPAIKDYYNIRRNLDQPFIGLGVNSFWVGRRPKFYMPYTDVARYAFARNQPTRPQIAFSLFPKSGARLVDIKGGGPVELKEERIVCRSVKLDSGVTAESFYNDFGSRLKAAGAVDALTAPEIVVKVNARTGEAWVLPEGPMAPLMTKIGAVLEIRQDSLKWLSWHLGFYCATTLIFVLLGVRNGISSYPYYGRSSAIVIAVISSLFYMIPTILLQEAIIHFLNKIQCISNYMEKTNERKKLLLGALVGSTTGLLAAYVVLKSQRM